MYERFYSPSNLFICFVTQFPNEKNTAWKIGVGEEAIPMEGRAEGVVPSACEEMHLMPSATKAKGKIFFSLELWYSSQENDWLLNKEDAF